MKNLILLLSLISILFACDTATEKPRKTEEMITTEATVLSLEEDLIMPSDYLTTVMTVVTRAQDTLRFLDMENNKNLVNKKVNLQYKIVMGRRLLVCFDCKTYDQKIELYDHSSFPSEITFESFKLKKYTLDEYLIPASMFLMQKEDGQTEEFRSLDMEMIVDSLKMATAYHQYGVITPLSPQLLSIKEY